METNGRRPTPGARSLENVVYKLMARREWEAALAEGVYRGSEHDRRDGFIHFSTAAQLSGTARKYFCGVPDLVVLEVDTSLLSWPPSKVASQTPEGDAIALDGRSLPSGREPELEPGHGQGALRWEPSRGGDVFPHLYADLPVAAVKSAVPVPLDDDGVPILPGDLPV
jgi:uncharacterized protein (DUF952 family)